MILERWAAWPFHGTMMTRFEVFFLLPLSPSSFIFIRVPPRDTLVPYDTVPHSFTMRSFGVAVLSLFSCTESFVPSLTGRSSRTIVFSSYLDSLSNNNANNNPAPQPTDVTNVGKVPATPPAAPAAATPVSSGTASASGAIASMAASQASIISQIASSIPDLAVKPDLSYDASSGFAIHGKAVSLDARDAPGPANIAWISSLCIDDTLSSLTIFNGPLTGMTS